MALISSNKQSMYEYALLKDYFGPLTFVSLLTKQQLNAFVKVRNKLLIFKKALKNGRG